MAELQNALLSWYDAEARPLPWRDKDVSAWDILLAEVILQQTQMDTGLPYWNRIRDAYPTPATLAADSEENLLKLWQGCGYYARARNLYKLACKVNTKPLPSTKEELINLPGIGPYTASAVASIAFGEKVACVDGNVRRVLSRLRAEHLSDNELQCIAEELLSEHRPGDWNQAMMELGALICTPSNPKCESCPLVSKCLAAATESPTEWPSKRKTVQKKVKATAIIIQGKSGLLLKVREGRTLGGLWGLPYFEGKDSATILLESLQIAREDVLEIGHIRHDFTHKQIEITVLMTGAKTEHELINPDSVPLATLDRKIIALYRGEQS